MRYLPEKAFLRVDEVAEFYSVTSQSVYRWIKAGKLKAIKVAGSVRVSREEVLDAVEGAPLQG